jgi:hypothetical protein
MPESIDIDALIARVPPLDPAWMKFARAYQEIKGPLPANYDITLLELRELAKAWGRSKKPAKLEIVAALKAIIAGESFAPEGGRDNMLYRLCATIKEVHPHASPESFARLLAPSLSKMGEDGPSFDSVLEKMRRRGRDEMSRSDRENNTRISNYFGNRRTTAYTTEELASFADQLEVNMGRRWIIQKDRSFYVWGGILHEDGTCHEGHYLGPFTQNEVANAARTILAPAASAGLALDLVTEKTTRPKTIAELIRDYGEVARKIECDMTAQCTYWDEGRWTVVEAPCPLRDIESKEHQAIDWWLRRFAGPDYDRLCEWIAGVTLLDTPATALYIEGRPGAGKSLLAQGLARLWTQTGPVEFASVLGGNFNESLARCPLVLGDETAPKDFRGRVQTAEIREFIQARQRSFKRKHLPEATIVGCVRAILTSNNKEMLNSSEHLTENDIAALVERFFYIYAPQEAADYLRELGETTVETWVTQDLIAEHALYLRDTYKVRRDRRFIASDTSASNALTRALATGSGIRGAVCNWLVTFLLEPSKLESSPARHLIKIYDNRIALNARILSDHWGMYPTNIPPPTATRISQAVSGLSNDRVHLRTGNTHGMMYRIIDTEYLVQWAEETGFAQRDTIDACIRTLAIKALSTSNAAPSPPLPKPS